MMLKKYFWLFIFCIMVLNLGVRNSFAETITNINNQNKEKDQVNEQERVKINLTQISEQEEVEALPWLNNNNNIKITADEEQADSNKIIVVNDKGVIDGAEAINEKNNLNDKKLPIEQRSLLTVYYKNNQFGYLDNDKEKLLEVIKLYLATKNNRITLKSFAYTNEKKFISEVRRKATKRVLEIRKYLIANGVDMKKISVIISQDILDKKSGDNSEDIREDKIEVFLGS